MAENSGSLMVQRSDSEDKRNFYVRNINDKNSFYLVNSLELRDRHRFLSSNDDFPRHARSYAPSFYINLLISIGDALRYKERWTVMIQPARDSE